MLFFSRFLEKTYCHTYSTKQKKNPVPCVLWPSVRGCFEPHFFVRATQQRAGKSRREFSLLGNIRIFEIFGTRQEGEGERRRKGKEGLRPGQNLSFLPHKEIKTSFRGPLRLRSLFPPAHHRKHNPIWPPDIGTHGLLKFPGGRTKNCAQERIKKEGVS